MRAQRNGQDTRSTDSAQLVTAAGLCLDVEARRVTRAEHEEVVRLTRKQVDLLVTFMAHCGEVLSRQFLMEHVWHTNYFGDTRTLEVHVCLIRKAIGDDPRQPVYLRTVRGIGYCFDPRPGNGVPRQ